MNELNKLDFNLIKALDALLTENSVTKAAERIGVTQPAMSGMLTRLRDAFGDPLFVRVQRGIFPTERAKRLALPVKQVLEHMENLLRPYDFDPATSTHTFRIAATDYALRAVVIPFIARLKKAAPKMKIALMPIEKGNVNHKLERGEFDLVLLARNNTSDDLHARTLYNEHYVCVLREGHPLAASSTISIDQFCSADHLLVSYSGGQFKGTTDEALEKIGRERNVSLSLKCFSLVPDIIKSTDMIAVLPSRLVSNIDGLNLLPAPLEISGFEQVAAWHERSHLDVAHQWVRNFLLETVSK